MTARPRSARSLSLLLAVAVLLVPLAARGARAAPGAAACIPSGTDTKSTHVGTPNAGCGGSVSAPGRFQVQTSTSSTLQPEFASARLTYVLGVAEHTPTGAVVSPVRPHSGLTRQVKR